MAKKKKIYIYRTVSACLLLLVWQIGSMMVGKEFLLPSPWVTFTTAVELIRSADFWQTVGFSFVRIFAGFLLALVVGALLAVLSFHSLLLHELITPILKAIKTAPVASFIILMLIWINSKNLSFVISFLTVLPMIYINFLEGIYSTDEKLLEMAQVFQMKKSKIIRYIYLPAIFPYFIAACSIGLGFCWKSGIAAEVIGNPTGSIGERLYQAKLYLMTGELFAWTILIIIFSILFEKVVMFCIREVKQWVSF